MSKSILDELRQEREVEFVVRGRKSGKELPRPVWFVTEADSLLLLPVDGSSTQWYKNIKKTPAVRISVAGQSAQGKATPIEESGRVREVVRLFTEKYGKGDMKKYYSKLDVAADVRIPAKKVSKEGKP